MTELKKEELLLLTRNLFNDRQKLEQENKTLQAQIEVYSRNAKHWARRFRTQSYGVPANVVEKLQKDFSDHQEQTASIIRELKAQKAVLVEKIYQMSRNDQRDEWHDEAPMQGNELVQLMESASEAALKPDDRIRVERELNIYKKLRGYPKGKGRKPILQ